MLPRKNQKLYSFLLFFISMYLWCIIITLILGNSLWGIYSIWFIFTSLPHPPVSPCTKNKRSKSSLLFWPVSLRNYPLKRAMAGTMALKEWPQQRMEKESLAGAVWGVGRACWQEEEDVHKCPCWFYSLLPPPSRALLKLTCYLLLLEKQWL